MRSVNSDTSQPVHWLLIAALVLFPVARGVAELLFVAFVLVIASRLSWKRQLSRPRTVVLALSLSTVMLWMISRIGEPWGTGLHSFRSPAHYPVTILDYVPFLTAFFVVSLQRWSPFEVRSFHWALAATVPLHFVFALIERSLEGTLQWELVVSGYPLAGLVLREPFNGRIAAGLYNAAGLACYAVLSGLAVASLLAVEWRSWRREARRGPWSVARIVFLASCLLFCLAMLVWSGSRGALAVAAMMSVPFVLTVGIKLRYVLIPILSGCLLIFAAAGDYGEVTRISREIIPRVGLFRVGRLPGTDATTLLSGRREIFGCAVELTRERPFAGWGIGNGAPECERRVGRFINHLHNIFSQLTAEIGIPFTALFSILMGYVFLSTAKHVLRLPDDERRIVYVGTYSMAVAVVLMSQLALAVMHSTRLEIVFWMSLAFSYSLVPGGASSSQRNALPPFGGDRSKRLEVQSGP